MRILQTKLTQQISMRKKKFSQAATALVVSLFCILLSNGALAQQAHRTTRDESVRRPASGPRTGVLLLAHGGQQGWNAEVNKLAAQVDKTIPVEVAFGMASKRTIQQGIDRLVKRGVQEIVAVPLFISSHSSVVTSTQYLLGQRAEAPSDLAVFAKMDHTHGQGDHSLMDASFDATTPVNSPVPIRMTGALDRHPLVADILLSRAQSISREPSQEVVIIVAHGPVPEDDNARWLADMGVLAERMRVARRFKRIAYLTVRDDAKDPVRAQATTELRQVVERAMAEGSRVLIVPLLLSYGGIEEGIKKRLKGLNYAMSAQGLLPDERLAQWVLLSVRENRQ